MRLRSRLRTGAARLATNIDFELETCIGPRARLLARAGPVRMVALVVFVRLRLLQIPLERDEGEFAYAGQLMLEGIPPYQLAWNMKLPGTYAAYAAMMALFGQSSGIHLGFLLANLAALALLFFIAGA